ncbi:MAG: [Fe-S]-binding protein, partial [Pirellulaceae bacterium]
MAKIPDFFRVRQSFERPQVVDIAVEVETQLASLRLGRTVKSGETVAISAGSRGIANIAVIIKAIADHVRSIGGQPWIIPAMGSHGGATAEGQRA